MFKRKHKIEPIINEAVMESRVKCINCIYYTSSKNNDYGDCNLPYLHHENGVPVVGPARTCKDYDSCGQFVDKATNMSYRDIYFNKDYINPNQVCCEKDNRIHKVGITAMYSPERCPIHGDPNL